MRSKSRARTVIRPRPVDLPPPAFVASRFLRRFACTSARRLSIMSALWVVVSRSLARLTFSFQGVKWRLDQEHR